MYFVNEVLVVVEFIGFLVVLKINLSDISYKVDVFGVFLNVYNVFVVWFVYKKIIDDVIVKKLDVKINGVIVEKMVVFDCNCELLMGIKYDDVFGFVIVFGYGGSLVEVL